MDNYSLCKYADLLLDYCLQLRPEQKLFIQSTTLAEPLVSELYRGSLERMAIVEINLSIKDQEAAFNQYGHPDAMKWVNPTYALAMESFDAYLYIRAPFETNNKVTLDKKLSTLRQTALMPYHKMYSTRTGNKQMRRTLCQYPTIASANDAAMSLDEYTKFVSDACYLQHPEPAKMWKQLSETQQHWVNHLNRVTEVRYKNNRTDISFLTKGRIWMNSDGQTNMPSGEIYTSPIEDSMNGFIFFDYPFLYQNNTIQGVHLEVEQGRVLKASADQGNEYLHEIINHPGADYFGEVAIGTNPNITKATKNILFDEKIAGTVHMALGQSYVQCGGKNESIIHQDMIADMRDGQIWADGTLIYTSGRFLI